jgi:hypothetical protein
VFVAQGIFLAIVSYLAGTNAPRGGVLALDALAAPGGEARIGVRLDRENPFFPGDALAGARVTFESAAAGEPAAGTPVGTATSGADGLAVITLPAPETPGIHRYRALVDPRLGGARLETTEAEVLLDVEPLDRSLLFVVLPPVPAADPLFAETAAGTEPPARNAAAVALRDMATRHPLIYVAALTDGARGLRVWLEHQGFPGAPVLFAPPGRSASPARAVLAGIDLTRRTAKCWAIAESIDDAAAFALAQVRVVLIRGAREKVEGSLIIPVAGWAEAARAIKG